MADRKINPGMAGDTPMADLTRRRVLKTSGVMTLMAVVPLLSHCSGSGGRDGHGTGAATPPARFLDEHQLNTLRALVDRLIPEDMDPGAVTACCAEAIDHLLAAFQSNPPFIYAGAPFSDRGGAARNDFLEFVPLDEYEELAWRLAIEGSQGLPEREFNGPVKGMQQIYVDGLARLDARAVEQGFSSFAQMPAPQRDLIIGDGSDGLVQEMMDIAFPDTLDAMYGPPEYGGNCALVGWSFTNFDGDVQPRGYTAEQVVNGDNPGPFDPFLPPSFGAESADPASVRAATGTAPQDIVMPSTLSVASSEIMAAAMMNADGSISRLMASLRPMAQQRVATLSSRVWQEVTRA